MTIALVITTISTMAQARDLARQLVEERLAACVQLTAVESIYAWDGLQQEQEVRLDCKTPSARAEALVARLGELHPYEVPEVLMMGGSASAAYSEFCQGATTPKGLVL